MDIMELGELLKQFKELTNDYYNAALSYDIDKSYYNKYKLLDKIDKVNSFRNKLSRDEFNFLRACAINGAYKNPALEERSKFVNK